MGRPPDGGVPELTSRELGGRALPRRRGATGQYAHDPATRGTTQPQPGVQRHLRNHGRAAGVGGVRGDLWSGRRGQHAEAGGDALAARLGSPLPTTPRSLLGGVGAETGGARSVGEAPAEPGGLPGARGEGEEASLVSGLAGGERTVRARPGRVQEWARGVAEGSAASDLPDGGRLVRGLLAATRGAGIAVPFLLLAASGDGAGQVRGTEVRVHGGALRLVPGADGDAGVGGTHRRPLAAGHAGGPQPVLRRSAPALHGVGGVPGGGSRRLQRSARVPSAAQTAEGGAGQRGRPLLWCHAPRKRNIVFGGGVDGAAEGVGTAFHRVGGAQPPGHVPGLQGLRCGHGGDAVADSAAYEEGRGLRVDSSLPGGS